MKSDMNIINASFCSLNDTTNRILQSPLSVLFCVVPPPTGLLRVQAAGLGVERTEDDEGEDFP